MYERSRLKAQSVATMASAKKIIDEIRQLSPRERRIVIKHLEQLKAKPTGTRRRRAVGGTKSGRSYAALIELAGVAHGEFDDVSTDKYRHLAGAYADTRDAT